MAHAARRAAATAQGSAERQERRSGPRRRRSGRIAWRAVACHRHRRARPIRERRDGRAAAGCDGPAPRRGKPRQGRRTAGRHPAHATSPRCELRDLRRRAVAADVSGQGGAARGRREAGGATSRTGWRRPRRRPSWWRQRRRRGSTRRRLPRRRRRRRRRRRSLRLVAAAPTCTCPSSAAPEEQVEAAAWPSRRDCHRLWSSTESWRPAPPDQSHGDRGPRIIKPAEEAPPRAIDLDADASSCAARGC